jgi:hypothetical protein
VTLTFLLLACNGGALVAAVLAFWRQRARIRGLQATLDAAQAERLLPNRGTKFRIVYYTDTGAHARDHFAQTRTAGTDLVEFWHFDVLRDHK